jgi:hypothetical protein
MAYHHSEFTKPNPFGVFVYMSVWLLAGIASAHFALAGNYELYTITFVSAFNLLVAFCD